MKQITKIKLKNLQNKKRIDASYYRQLTLKMENSPLKKKYRLIKQYIPRVSVIAKQNWGNANVKVHKYIKEKDQYEAKR